MDQATTPPAARRAERARMRRSQVLEAAKHCFRRVGFHSTSMAEIAKQAGMSVGHIYRYFPSKEALIEAIVTQDMDDQDLDQLALDTAQGAANDGDDLLASMAARSADFVAQAADREHTALMLEILAETARNPRVREIVMAADARGQGALRGRLLPFKPVAWSDAEFDARLQLFSAMLQGLAVQLVRMPQGLDETTLALLDRVSRDLLQPGDEARRSGA